jgi:hypothetical protein
LGTELSCGVSVLALPVSLSSTSVAVILYFTVTLEPRMRIESMASVVEADVSGAGTLKIVSAIYR